MDISCDAVILFAERHAALAEEMAGSETDSTRRRTDGLKINYSTTLCELKVDYSRYKNINKHFAPELTFHINKEIGNQVS